MSRRSLLVCQRTQEWVSRNSAWPRIVPGPRRPSWSAQRIGVTPWRRIISRTSLTLCEQWVVNGRPRSVAAARLSRSSASVQVSICIGETTPDNRPLGCASASSITASALIKPARPRGSFQS